MMNNPLNAYKQTAVKTAGQGKLIVMLYDEGIRQLDMALKFLAEEKPPVDKIHNAIVKTQDVVTELMVSLDFDKGQEIAKNLFSLYMYFNQQLLEANLSKDARVIREVRRLMAELRGAWATIAGKSSGSGERPVSGGVNIAG